MFINMLPDDVLLGIFDFHVLEDRHTGYELQAWQSLVHVCRRWRSLVFGSPRRLDLRLFCSTKTPVRDLLDVWPPFPLLIKGSIEETEELDNTIAVFERRDRVFKINIYFPGSHFEDVLIAMQMPFPVLEYLGLFSYNVATVIPDSFLGGSAPHLRFIWLNGLPFPSLPKLLLSATHLVTLNLTDIPHPEYFSLDTIVPVLFTLTSLGSFRLEFMTPRSLPERGSRLSFPPNRSALPFLRLLAFRGVSDYLEDLVARIDTPRLKALYIIFFNQVVFDTRETIQFISRTPSLGPLEEARLAFQSDAAGVRLSTQKPGFEQILVTISCRVFDWQVSSLEQICTSSLPLLSKLEDLYIFEEINSPPNWKDNIENSLWLELLHPFMAVKNLYLSEKFALCIAPALQELVGGRTTEVLPTLQNLFLEGLQPSGPDQEGIVKFVATRQFSGCPITVSLWDRATFSSYRGMLQ